jgi:hypothetical protein
LFLSKRTTFKRIPSKNYVAEVYAFEFGFLLKDDSKHEATVTKSLGSLGGQAKYEFATQINKEGKHIHTQCAICLCHLPPLGFYIDYMCIYTCVLYALSSPTQVPLGGLPTNF